MLDAGKRNTTIIKPVSARSSHHNISSYEDTYRQFTWEGARKSLAFQPEGHGINIAYEALERHVDEGHGTMIALRWCDSRGNVKNITYSDLSCQSNAFANILTSFGIGPGETVFTLLGRVPELFTCSLGTLKNKSIFCPLFSVFGPEPIQMRLALGNAKALVTTQRLYERKILALRPRLPNLQHVFVIPTEDEANNTEGTINLSLLLKESSKVFEIPPTSPNDPALIHFTSGTTGTPKGALHVHDAIVCHKETGKFVLDLKPDDIFWCTADPGWVTGTSYGIFSPLANRVTMIVDEGEFDPERWYSILEKQKVTVLYTAPTAIRMLMKAGEELRHRFDLSSLRHVASVGEPLNPEAILWGDRVLGLPIHDNWWQTETGGIMIANFPSMDIKPGSMGRPIPGITAGVVKVTENDLTVIDAPDIEGELAIKTPWPSMFRTYLGQEERYKACFRDGWYLTGDLVKRDHDGYYWFIGRSDDVIKSSGHLIGPFEVESILMEHEAVAEAGVIGKPDPLLGESVKAFISLKIGFQPTDDVKKGIMALARRRLGPAIAPREIAFLDSLPRTRSGKVMRRLLKARELGLPEGDISTLEVSQEKTAVELHHE